MATTLHSSDITGVQKAAILLIALGPERSSKIFQHLKDDEIEALTLEIANTKSVSAELKDEVLDEFYEVCLAQQYIAEGGIAYAKELLDKALGEDRARDVIGRLTASLQVRPFEFVRKADASQLLNFIQDEHPQTIALILAYLPASQAAAVVSALAPEKQAYRNDGSNQPGCNQRSGKDIGEETGVSGQSGLHDCRWCGFHRQYPEYGRPEYRETYYGKPRNRGTGIGRRDPQKDVCIRGYSAA